MLGEKVSKLSLGDDVDGDVVADELQRHVNMLHLRVLTRVFHPLDTRLVVLVQGDWETIAGFTSHTSRVKFGVKTLKPACFTYALVKRAQFAVRRGVRDF